MSSLYILALLASLGCLLLVDYRFKLAWFKSRKRSLRTVVVGICFFVVWDIVGILLDIFYTGSSPYILRLFLAPDFPVEELFFLALLMYSSLIIYRLLEEKA